MEAATTTDSLLTSPFALAIICSIAYGIYISVKQYFLYLEETDFGDRHGCKSIPQLPNTWPLGVDWVYRIFNADTKGHLLEFFNEEANIYLPRNMVSQMFLFGPRTYHVMDPVNVEAILSTNFDGRWPVNVDLFITRADSKVDFGFGVRHEVFAPLLGNGIFTQEGNSWRTSRELLRHQFVRTQYQNLNGFRHHVDNLLACLPSGGLIDLQPLFFRLTLDTTTALLMGQSSYSLKSNDVDDAGASSFAKNFDLAQKGLATRFRLAPLHWLYKPSHFKRSCQTVHRFVDAYIEQHSSREKTGENSENETFVDLLRDKASDHEALRDQLLNILLAGRDTTACCLSWTMRLLVRHSQVMRRLREEIKTVLGTEHPSRDHIRRMPYLSFVIKESLRLYPPVPVNNRTAIRTTTLPRGGGSDGKSPILIRRGEIVSFGLYVIARRPNIWGPEAEKFVPERWEDRARHPSNGAYFPFSGGPRNCLGQDFATMEVSYTIVRLLQAYPYIGLPPGEENATIGAERQRLTLVLSSADGCKIDLAGAQ